MSEAKLLIGDEISLEQWVAFMKMKPKNIQFEDYMFPSDTIKDSFITRIHEYDENDVLHILACFLDFSGPLGSDRINLSFILQLLKDNREEAEKLIKKSPYYRRMLKSIRSGGKLPMYDSILWVLDLLPGFPRDALNVIAAFSALHLNHLPDGRMHGLFDAEDIIRAKYFDAKTDRSVLYSLTPTEFEHVVEALYNDMGYATRMTKKTHDGGRDVIADKMQAGSKEHLVISCKRLRDNVEPVDYREIMFAVENEKATKGVVVTTSDFSKEAYREAGQNPRMELINQDNLQKMLNERLGATWSAHLSFYIKGSQERHPDGSRV